MVSKSPMFTMLFSNQAPKTLIGALLLVFVVASVVYMAVKEPRRDAGDATPGRRLPAVEGVEPDVIVYFFYNDIRCDVCLRLEDYAVEALKTHFSDELASGAIQWRMLSMDDHENEHFLIDFELYSKSVVLVELEDAERVRFKNLEDIWDLVYDKPAYLEYMRTNVLDFLGAAP